jgi:hypothetical protein
VFIQDHKYNNLILVVYYKLLIQANVQEMLHLFVLEKNVELMHSIVLQLIHVIMDITNVLMDRVLMMFLNVKLKSVRLDNSYVGMEDV